MPLTKMEHFLVLTDDIEASKDFYCKVLGMQLGMRPPLEFPGYWLYLGDIPCIHIAEWETYRTHSEGLGIPVTTKSASTGAVDHIAFNATDFDGVVARIRDNEVDFTLNSVPDIGLRQLFVEDPNGVKIEINIMSEVAKDNPD